jgi:hypothetical protein
MLQKVSICHKNASRVHQTSIVEHFLKNLKNFPFFYAHEKNGRSAPLISKAVEITFSRVHNVIVSPDDNFAGVFISIQDNTIPLF